MNVDGTNQRPLVDPTTGQRIEGWAPNWSPNGKQLAYVTINFEIGVVNLDGSQAHSLTSSFHDSLSITGFPAWSPDGTQIAFEALSSDNWDIYTIDSAGSTLHRLTTHIAGDSHPSWQPASKAVDSIVPTITVVPQKLAPTFIPQKKK